MRVEQAGDQGALSASTEMGAGTRSAVHTADGGAHPVDALFTMAQPRTHNGFLDHLGLEQQLVGRWGYGQR